MDSFNDVMRELERPPSKYNLSVLSIIQSIIMLYIGFDSGKEVFDLFKIGGFSFIDLLKLIVDGAIFVGMIIAAYGMFTEKSDSMLSGFKLFFLGCLGLIFIWILDTVKGGFRLGSFIEILFICFVTYVLYLQMQHI